MPPRIPSLLPRRALALLCLLNLLGFATAATTPAARAVLANAFHIPDNTSDLNGTPMRNPRFEIGANTAVTVYSGVQKFGNPFGTANQTGGTLFYKGVSQSTWSSVALVFHLDKSPNQYWRATFNTSVFGINEVIQYYLLLTFNAGAENTYVCGGDGTVSQVTASEATAATNPFTIRNRPAFVFHADNRVVNGTSVQFYAKVGYLGKDGTTASQWADSGALYYTTDGSDPAGALGVAATGGTTTAVPLVLDHLENDPSVAGNAMWWRGTVDGLPTFTNVRYKLSLWHSANNEEKFADYNAPTDPRLGRTFAFSLGNLGDPLLTVNGVSANYTTTHVFIDERRGDAPPLAVVFEPGVGNVDPATVQVFTNLNRRDRATADANADGIEDGIQPPSGDLVGTGDEHYYRAFPMVPTTSGRYELTLPANRTGAYRLTARYRLNNSATWVYYTSNGRRDHAVVVSPQAARDINLYEINTLNINATGTLFSQRGTFADLFDPTKRANLDYIKSLGCNHLWFQPIHPNGVDGRQIDPDTNAPFEVGSPYAVKNFFEVMPIMSRANTRPAAMTEFQQFVAAADAKGMGVMLDAPFNHTSYDCELAAKGVELFSPGANALDEIRNREARVFSANNDYDNRASGSGNIAVAPDRGDFGKFGDTYDVFYGSYSSLVDDNPGDNGGYLNEGDVFFYNDPDWTNPDFAANGQPQNVTKNVWKYFADYLVYWIQQTGGTPAALAANPDVGVDSLRADFGQGLPPQAWEYIINKTRTLKWNFVFMSESLDGGAVTYRSNRHFDILNENIVFPFQAATTTGDYRNIFEQRRQAYGQGLVLLNSTSHDEENYVDPYQALIRYTVSGAIDGATLIFYGQENGISRTFGFDRYETNFGKQITHFKKFNSLGPILAPGNRTFALDQLYPVYAAVGQARGFSPALRSSNRFFLNQTDNSVQTKVFSVAKFEARNAAPGVSDVVFAFANLDRDNDQQGNFNVAQDVDNNGVNDYGLKPARLYNVRNIAAYTGLDATRRDRYLFTDINGNPQPRTGSDLITNGLFVALKKVPTANAGWSTAPFEAQYLKLYDVTPPPAPGQPATARGYALGNSVTFAWAPASDPEGGIAGYRLVVTDANNNVVFDANVGNVTSYTLTNQPFGRTLFARVTALNNASVPGAASTASAGTVVLDPVADQDGDGASNVAEDNAGTDLFDARSLLRVVSTERLANNAGVRVTWSSVPGKTYVVQATTDLQSVPFADLSGSVPAEVGPATQTGYTDTTAPTGNGAKRFYRVRVATGP